jgi:hypothetical protein
VVASAQCLIKILTLRILFRPDSCKEMLTAAVKPTLRTHSKNSTGLKAGPASKPNLHDLPRYQDY